MYATVFAEHFHCGIGRVRFLVLMVVVVKKCLCGWCYRYIEHSAYAESGLLRNWGKKGQKVKESFGIRTGTTVEGRNVRQRRALCLYNKRH